MDFLPSYGTYREGDNIISTRLGLVQLDNKVIKIIPLSGKYLPKRGDTIIGHVTEILSAGWRVELNCAWMSLLGIANGTTEYIKKGEDLSQFYAIGDYILAQITNVTKEKLIDLTMKGPGLKRLGAGRIIPVNTNKVPRIIGKGGSMVSMIKNATGCRIVVGQNGRIWLQGEPKEELIAEKTIKMIEDNAHTSGLTEKVKAHLEKETGKKIEARDNNGVHQEA
jgi:exosome complex component RRP4